MGRRVTTVAAVVAVLVAALAVVLHAVDLEWRPVLAVTALAHYAMWAAAAGVVLAVLARARYLVAVSVVVAVAVLALQVPPVLGTVNVVSGRPLVVLQANLGVGSARPADVVARVRADHVDVLATEELTVAEQRRLVRAGLARLLPYRFTRPLPTGGGGIGVWSRYPLVGARDRGGFWLGVITARVRLPVATVSLVAVHLTPPYPYPSTRWRHEIARLRTLLPRSGAAVVAGDFNATVDHTRYRALLRRGYRDAAVEAGAGYLPTYPTDRWYGPVIGIDHVLVRGRVRARDVLTLDQPGSDHRALLARLVY